MIIVVLLFYMFVSTDACASTHPLDLKDQKIPKSTSMLLLAAPLARHGTFFSGSRICLKDLFDSLPGARRVLYETYMPK